MNWLTGLHGAIALKNVDLERDSELVLLKLHQRTEERDAMSPKKSKYVTPKHAHHATLVNGLTGANVTRLVVVEI